jgi:two-component system cell cycle sensor histidine kinase/response regulator CckA
MVITRILVVEDEAAHAEAICRSLGIREGAECRVLRTLHDYLEQGIAWGPEIVLMDLHLPDGQATEVLQDSMDSRAFPIVIMTSYGNEQVAVETLRAGAFDYMVKSPETFRALPQMLERVLNQWQIRAKAQQSLRELEESEEKYRTLFDHAGDAILIHDLDLRMLAVNPMACDRLGYTQAELLSMSIRQLDSVEDLPLVSERVSRLMDQGFFAFETRHLCKDGSFVPMEVHSRRISWGGHPAIMSICRDLTERKRAEEEQLQLRERMNQMQKLEALGILVAGVAHNLNNVLAAIMATASTRERLAKDPKDQEAFRIIDTSCARGRDVVKSLMHFAKPTLTNQASFDLNGILSEVRMLLESTTRNHIQIVELSAREPAWVFGDAGSISNALMNLCLNALDAMPHGGRLTLRILLTEDGWIELLVEDCGEGMSPEVLSRAMEPFYTTKPVGKGTGLGLSMAHGIVKAHGGSMEIVSQKGQGTTVRWRLPRVEPPAMESPLKPDLQIRPLSILLVDDDEDVRYLMARMLKAAGHRVAVAPGGAQALEQLQAGPLPDLVILDQNMPGMDGAQTLERIRALPLPLDLPVLISSGQPDIQSWPCFRQANVAVISKPFTMDEVSAKLSTLPTKR